MSLRSSTSLGQDDVPTDARHDEDEGGPPPAAGCTLTDPWCSGTALMVICRFGSRGLFASE